MRHHSAVSGVTKAGHRALEPPSRGRNSLRALSPLGVGLRRCGPAARARPQAPPALPTPTATIGRSP